MPKLNELYEQHHDKGLEVIGLYAQNEDIDDVRAFIEKRKIKFPMCYVWDYTAGYYVSSMPGNWVIDAEGKLQSVGKDKWEEPLKAALGKVVVPGLSIEKKHKDAEPALNAFAQRDYAKAHKLATELSDNSEDKEVRAQAQAVIDAVEERVKALLNKAEIAQNERQNPLAIAAWSELATRFAGIDGAEEAEANLKRLREDKQVKREMDAEAAYHKLDRMLVREDVARKDWSKRFADFAKQWEKTRAAELAGEQAERFKDEK